jgi:ankyrin repeat protein
VDFGAPIDEKSKNGSTALYLAVRVGERKIVEYLLEKGNLFLNLFFLVFFYLFIYLFFLVYVIFSNNLQWTNALECRAFFVIDVYLFYLYKKDFSKYKLLATSTAQMWKRGKKINLASRTAPFSAVLQNFTQIVRISDILLF